jgi:hypothetical protein
MITLAIRRLPLDRRDLIPRILAQCIEVGECLIWTGTVNDKGYGQIFTGKRTRWRVHRLVAYACLPQEFDLLDRKVQVCHTCDTPPCCEPAHLFLGTNQSNSIDAFNKERRHYWLMPPHKLVELEKQRVNKVLEELGVSPLK